MKGTGIAHGTSWNGVAHAESLEPLQRSSTSLLGRNSESEHGQESSESVHVMQPLTSLWDETLKHGPSVTEDKLCVQSIPSASICLTSSPELYT